MSNVTAVPLQPVKRGYLVWLWVGIVAAVIAALFLARQADSALLRESRGGDVVTTASGLKYKVLTAGKGGAHPTEADVALVMYEGKLLNGTTFDKSPQPVPFPLAPGATVPGFAEALKLMTKGEKTRFWIPPNLGYGAEAKGPIPANSTLVFDVELLDFLPQQVIEQMRMQQGMGQGGGMPGGPGGGLPSSPGAP